MAKKVDPNKDYLVFYQSDGDEEQVKVVKGCDLKDVTEDMTEHRQDWSIFEIGEQVNL